MIVVAGGSGVLGRLVVAELTGAGQAVRVLVRDAEHARTVLGPDVDVVVADVRSSDGLSNAVAGATAVVSAVHGMLGGRGAGPAEVDHNGNAHLAAAARANGAAVVLVSVIGASPDSPIDLFRAKYAAEQELKRGDTAWTIVRSAAFAETWMQILRQTAGKSGRPLVFGHGQQPIAFVSAADVAAVVARAATDPALHGRVLEISGERLTMMQLAEAVQAADGRDTTPRHLPRAVLRTMATAARPVRPAFARQNRAAYVMDTVDLGDGDPDLRAELGLPPARTVTELLHS